MSVLLLTVGCICIAMTAAAQTHPFDTPADAEQGKALFQTHCSYCHGASGQGGRGIDLTTGQYRRGGSPGNLYATVRNGIPGTEMPAVKVTDDEVWKLVAFVRKLAAAAPVERGSGDPAAGRRLFTGKGGCIACHGIGTEGGSLGPDLTDVGRRRDLAYLEESLLRPEADVPVRFRAVELSLKSGGTVTGIRLNEDDVSIQLRDTQEILRSFFKSDLRAIRTDRPSLMPAFGAKLSKQEIDDVVAYLTTLRGGAQ